MKKHVLSIILLSVSLLLSGCRSDTILPDNTPAENTPSEATGTENIEPTIVYGWTSGESPVPNERIGMYRAGLNGVAHAVSPTGIYFIDRPSNSSKESYVIYSDNGSNTFIRLCGRPDCTHVTPDCNAYLYDGSVLSYFGGYLYAVSGGENRTDECKLVRMNPDGTNHTTVLDLMEYAKENGGDYASAECITEGFCLFSIYRWEVTESVGVTERRPKHMGYYYYKLDGSMEKPEYAMLGGLACYSCADVFLTYHPQAVNGGAYGSYRDWDANTNSATFLTDHPGEPGWFGRTEGYYFRDGYICRLTYATQKEEFMVDTGLDGEYYLFAFQDCLVLASNEKNSSDHNLYIYNWSFELLDKVSIYNPTSDRTQFMLIAETAERLILTDEFCGMPKYYINKADFGTGNVKVHNFNLPDL